MVCVHLPSTNVDKREMLVYWEDDLIKGKNHPFAIGTLA